MFVIPPKLNNKLFKELPKILSDELINSKKFDISNIIESSINTELKLVELEKKRKIKLLKLKFVRKIKIIIRKNDEKENHKALNLFIEYYLKEINAGFRSYLFPILELILPVVINFLLYSLTFAQFFKNFLGQTLTRKKVIVRGNKNLIRSLDKKGALVFLPTHVSHIDSLIIAYALIKLRVKPPLWGAGLNLFTNFILSYLMNSVGCYKIDRRKKNVLYLETLKEYSTYQLSNKYNSLFYPGGTRSRSGAIETKLKLGLLGTITKAFLNKVKENNEISQIYIVPITLSYSIVPEAECLSYENFFGKHAHRKMLQRLQIKFSKFFIELKRIFNLARLNSTVYCTFGDPIDPLGNKVNSEGKAIDSDGVPIDFKSSINITDQNLQKNITVKLGEIISDNFFKSSVILPTQVFLYSIVEYITLNNPELSEHEIVRLNPEENIVTIAQLKVRIKRIIQKLINIQKTKGMTLDALIKENNYDKIVELGINTYTKEYNASPISINGDYIIPKKIPLIWYYSDRIRTFLIENPENVVLKKWIKNK